MIRLFRYTLDFGIFENIYTYTDNMNKLLNKIIDDVSLDERVSNGMFNVEEDAHMEALRDYLKERGIDEDAVNTFSNRVLEGKYPERQAFNAKGILVTFPTPEYKAEAIKRGTHFEENPVKKMSNIFSDPAKLPATPPPASEKKPVAEPDNVPAEPKTNLPVSQATSQTSAPEDTTNASPSQVKTTAAPQQTPTSTLSTEPVKEPTDLPEPPQKSTAEKEADKNAIKTMLKGDDYMLERIKKMIGVSNYMLERIIEHALKDENLHYDIMSELQCRNEEGKLITEKKL